MNYDKQIPLTQEEIDYINSKPNIKLKQIPDYPKNNVHVEIDWNIPIKIRRNEDGFYFGYGYAEVNKTNYWVVHSYEHSETDFRIDFETRQFKDIDDALNYAIESYEKWINYRAEYIKSLKV